MRRGRVLGLRLLIALGIRVARRMTSEELAAASVVPPDEEVLAALCEDERGG